MESCNAPTLFIILSTVAVVITRMDSPATVINAAFVTYVVVNAVMKTFSQHVMPLCFSGLRNYITKIQKGEGQSGKQYSARYICSLVADFHRTLLYGGWAGV